MSDEVSAIMFALRNACQRNVAGIWTPQSGFQNLEFSIWSLTLTLGLALALALASEFGIWNLEFGIWNLEFSLILFMRTLRYQRNVNHRSSLL
jgi:hypothetical protein